MHSPFFKSCFPIIAFACALSFVGFHTSLCADEPATTPAAVPAVAEQDLGQGLAYLRITNLGEQLPSLRTALAAHPALVIDARSSTGDTKACEAFRDALLPNGSKGRRLRLLLLNTNSAPALSITLGVGLPGAGLPDTLTVAPTDSAIDADLKATCSSEDDQRACDAIASGAPLSSLLNHQPEKQRYDEAVLAKEYTPLPEINVIGSGTKAISANDKVDPTAAEKSAAPTTAAANVTETKTPSETAQVQTPPMTDAVLQLAVHMHRALVALNRLPTTSAK